MKKERKKLTDEFCEICEQRIKYMKLIDEALENQDYEALEKYIQATTELTKKSDELTKMLFDDEDLVARLNGYKPKKRYENILIAKNY